MRAPAALMIFILTATPALAAGRYDPDYPVCMEAYGMDGSRIECFFTSMDQCKLSTSGSSGTCFNNPAYVAPKPEPAPEAQAAPPAPKAAKTASKKSKRTVEPPAPTPTRSQ